MTKLAVLDASAILAHIFGEPGFIQVRRFISYGVVSAANYSEVIARLSDLGHLASQIKEIMQDYLTSGLEVLPFHHGLAESAGLLRAETRKFGLSLGDRACLATAMEANLPALTADRAWLKLDLGVDIILVRD